MHLTLPSITVANYGAPTDVWVTYTATKGTPTMSVDLQWFNKTATRLPEFFMFDFVPAPQAGFSWSMDKMDSPVSPLEVVWGGSQLQHGVWGGVTYSIRDTYPSLHVSSSDVPLVSPITTFSQSTPMVCSFLYT